MVQIAEIRRPVNEGLHMSVLVFVALTVAVFALLGLVQKWVEQL